MCAPIDLLESLDQVDRDRIGCVGHSLGGHNGLFTAAFDQRIRAVVSSCGFNALEDYAGGDLTGWSSPRYMPLIRSKYGADARRMPFDFQEVLAVLAPRPIFVHAPMQDDNFPVVGVRKVIESVRPVYRWYGAEDDLHVIHPDVGHDFPDDVRQQVYAWLKIALRKK